MYIRARMEAPPTVMNPMCAAPYWPLPPVTIPNAFCPIDVGPCGDAPAAAGVAASPYPEPNDPCPCKPMFRFRPMSGLRRCQRRMRDIRIPLAGQVAGHAIHEAGPAGFENPTIIE